MALKGTVVYKGISIADTHCVIHRANQDCNYAADIDGNIVKTLTGHYLVKFYKDAATYAATPTLYYDQEEIQFVPSVANGANLNIMKQAYGNMKTIAAYDDFTDV